MAPMKGFHLKAYMEGLKWMIDEFRNVLKNKAEFQWCRFDPSKTLNYTSVPEY